MRKNTFLRVGLVLTALVVGFIVLDRKSVV